MRSTYLKEKKKERKRGEREREKVSIPFGPSLRFSSPRSNDPRRLKRSNDRLYEDRAIVAHGCGRITNENSAGDIRFSLFAFHAAQYKLSSIQSYLQKTRRTQAQEGGGRGEEGSGWVGGQKEGGLRDKR